MITIDAMNDFTRPHAFALLYMTRDLAFCAFDSTKLRDELRDYLTTNPDDNLMRLIDLNIDDSRDNTLADDFMNYPFLAQLFNNDDDKLFSLREIDDTMTTNDSDTAYALIIDSYQLLLESK